MTPTQLENEARMLAISFATEYGVFRRWVAAKPYRATALIAAASFIAGMLVA